VQVVKRLGVGNWEKAEETLSIGTEELEEGPA